MWKKIKSFFNKTKNAAKLAKSVVTTVVAKPPAPLPPKGAVLDRTYFFYMLPAKYKPELPGYNFIFDKWEESKLTDIRWLAYMLATTWHETAFTMRPVTEYGSLKYLRSKKYWPYIGRGYVQITWLANYKKYGIENDMTKALDPHFAAYIMIDGMTKGVFTGKKLSDYFSQTKNDPVGARRIINGTDKDRQIAEHYYAYLKALV